MFSSITGLQAANLQLYLKMTSPQVFPLRNLRCFSKEFPVCSMSKKKKKIEKQSFPDVLQSRCSLKFNKIYRKTPVLQSLFDNVAGLRPAAL